MRECRALFRSVLCPPGALSDHKAISNQQTHIPPSNPCRTPQEDTFVLYPAGIRTHWQCTTESIDAVAGARAPFGPCGAEGKTTTKGSLSVPWSAGRPGAQPHLKYRRMNHMEYEIRSAMPTASAAMRPKVPCTWACPRHLSAPLRGSVRSHRFDACLGVCDFRVSNPKTLNRTIGAEESGEYGSEQGGWAWGRHAVV